MELLDLLQLLCRSFHCTSISTRTTHYNSNVVSHPCGFATDFDPHLLSTTYFPHPPQWGIVFVIWVREKLTSYVNIPSVSLSIPASPISSILQHVLPFTTTYLPYPPQWGSSLLFKRWGSYYHLPSLSSTVGGRLCCSRGGGATTTYLPYPPQWGVVFVVQEVEELLPLTFLILHSGGSSLLFKRWGSYYHLRSFSSTVGDRLCCPGGGGATTTYLPYPPQSVTVFVVQEVGELLPLTSLILHSR